MHIYTRNIINNDNTGTFSAPYLSKRLTAERAYKAVQDNNDIMWLKTNNNKAKNSSNNKMKTKNKNINDNSNNNNNRRRRRRRNGELSALYNTRIKI